MPGSNIQAVGAIVPPPSKFVPHNFPPQLVYDVEVQGLSPLLTTTQTAFVDDVNAATDTIAEGRVGKNRMILRYTTNEDAWSVKLFLNRNNYNGKKLTALFKENILTSTVGSAGSQAWVKVEPP